jgi:putative lipoic acid-binding regulatory protein
MNEQRSPKSVLESAYPIKVVAHNQATTIEEILKVVNNHFPSSHAEQATKTESKNKQYVSLTLFLNVKDEKQLEDLHESLKAIDGIVMVL